MDLGVSLIKAIVTLFDYALYPFYMVIHRPWLVIKRRQKQRAWLSYLAKNRVLYKGVQVMMNFFKPSEDCESGGSCPMPRPQRCLEQQEQMRLLPTHNQSLRPLFLMVSWDLCV